MVEMTVFGLALDEESQMPILILKDETDTHVLPIWIGAVEAMAISMAINKIAIPRPMTHDLILNVMQEMGGHLDHVEILAIDKGTYYAALVISTPRGIKRLDSRPSDSIALALKAGVSIMASQSMLEQALSQKKVEYQEVIKGEDAKQWTEILAKYNLDDIRFKM